jgi:hypothetical protein
MLTSVDITRANEKCTGPQGLLVNGIIAVYSDRCLGLEMAFTWRYGARLGKGFGLNHLNATGPAQSYLRWKQDVEVTMPNRFRRPQTHGKLIYQSYYF